MRSLLSRRVGREEGDRGLSDARVVADVGQTVGPKTPQLLTSTSPPAPPSLSCHQQEQSVSTAPSSGTQIYCVPHTVTSTTGSMPACDP